MKRIIAEGETVCTDNPYGRSSCCLR